MFPKSTIPSIENAHECGDCRGSLYSIEHSNGGLITFPGGLPIKNAAGQIIAAIGVSGDTVENDHMVAQPE